MFHTRKIASFEEDELWPYRTMRLQGEHRRHGIFVAEGEKVVRRLLSSGFTVVSVVLPEKWLSTYAPLLEARSEEILVYLAEKQLLEQLTGYSFFQGVLAVARIPAPPPWPGWLETQTRPWFLAAADGISNAENIGVLVRNCAAFGVQALLVGENSASPYLRRAVRSSMGTLFSTMAMEMPGLVESLKRLQSLGVRCIAAHPHSNGRTLPETDLTGDCCLVFGSEGLGLTRTVLAACNEAVAVPMAPPVDSLNVGSASALFLYETARQRGWLASGRR